MYSRMLLPLLMTTSLAAATITYYPTEQSGGQTANLSVTFTQDTSSSPIFGRVSVTPNATDPDVGDIRGLFFDLVNLPAGLTAAQVLGAISGPQITSSMLNTSSVGGTNVNPLGPFSVALVFGTNGAGRDDIRSTTFQINNSVLTPDLSLSNLGQLAVRVTSIGAQGGVREGSGKFLAVQGTLSNGADDPGDPTPIPEPSTYILAGSALLLLGWLRRAGQTS